MMRAGALLAVLALVTSASAMSFAYPRRLVCRGTITTNGATGTLVARTHLKVGRDIAPHYPGRFRCRGAGCPVHHGRIDLRPDDASPW